MSETDAKYHHLIPRTYLRAWANASDTLRVEFKNKPGHITDRNVDRIAGINDYYSIRAGMPICTESDAETIFQPVKDYIVEYKGEQLQTPLQLNHNFSNFSEWTIKRHDGTIVSKNRIKREIDKIKVKDIEVNWSSKYENLWKDEVKKIETAVLSAPNGNIPAFDKEYLMRFYTALDWRAFKSSFLFETYYKQLLQAAFDNTVIPFDQRILPSIKTVEEEMRYYLLLKFYRDYLNDTGVIYTDAMVSLSRMNLHFLIASGSVQFFTCDTPAFVHNSSNGLSVCVFPITPKILMLKGKCIDEPDNYYVTHINDKEVIYYNIAIRNSATTFIIYPHYSDL